MLLISQEEKKNQKTKMWLFFFKVSFRNYFEVDFSLATKLNVFPIGNLPHTLN
jgi:hypothetical protein